MNSIKAIAPNISSKYLKIIDSDYLANAAQAFKMARILNQSKSDNQTTNITTMISQLD